IGVAITEYNEYGGVGGRFYIFSETLKKIFLPGLLDTKYILLGFGVGSFGNIFKSIVSNSYFESFGSSDNSYLQWIVEFGLTPFIFTIYYVLFNFKRLV